MRRLRRGTVMTRFLRQPARSASQRAECAAGAADVLFYSGSTFATLVLLGAGVAGPAPSWRAKASLSLGAV